jgi:hypothetical protein
MGGSYDFFTHCNIAAISKMRIRCFDDCHHIGDCISAGNRWMAEVSSGDLGRVAFKSSRLQGFIWHSMKRLRACKILQI